MFFASAHDWTTSFHHLRLRDRQRGSRHLSATRWRFTVKSWWKPWRWTMKHIEHIWIHRNRLFTYYKWWFSMAMLNQLRYLGGPHCIEHMRISSLMLYMLYSSPELFFLACVFVGLMRLAIYLNLLNQIQTGVTIKMQRDNSKCCFRGTHPIHCIFQILWLYDWITP